jgi:hypothetical protein
MGTRIEVRVGSLTDGDETVLINASNTLAWLGSGVSSAIPDACGGEMYQRAIERARRALRWTDVARRRAGRGARADEARAAAPRVPGGTRRGDDRARAAHRGRDEASSAWAIADECLPRASASRMLAFDRLASAMRAAQVQIEKSLERHASTNRSCVDEGVLTLELANSAAALDRNHSECEKRLLLDFVLSNSTWANGTLSVTFREPFNNNAPAGWES